mmetsp:Transcript_12221/g.18269  ORF Transcript_12221/g.18269 Transcript_12221/m.18269 type:complete len:81 (+) Transcript_12221:181-423(+)
MMCSACVCVCVCVRTNMRVFLFLFFGEKKRGEEAMREKGVDSHQQLYHTTLQRFYVCVGVVYVTDSFTKCNIHVPLYGAN